MPSNNSTKNLSISDLILVNTSFFNILFPIALILFIKNIPQANHIILSKLGDGDPISSTLFILLYSLFISYIYYSQRYINYGHDTSQLSVVFDLVNRISFCMPMTVWLSLIIRNNWNSHLWSIIIAIVLIIMIYLFLCRQKENHPIVKFPISYLIYLFTLAYILLAAIFFKDIDYGRSPIVLMLLSIFIAVLYLILKLIEKRFDITSAAQEVSKSSFIGLGIVLLILVIITISIHPKYIFSPINILLLYVLTLRIFFYLIGKGISILSKDLTFDKVSKNLFHVKVSESNYLSKGKSTILYVSTIFIVMFLLWFISRSYQQGQHEIILSKYNGKRQKIENYIENWLRKENTDSPIFLVTGQGGGSRAGLAFFHTISLLDSVLKNNVLSINTISGSGTGAQFYLSAKKNLGADYYKYLIDQNQLHRADSILYRRDYISRSLFKLLFSDYVRSKFNKRAISKSRNYSLIEQEQEAYQIFFDSVIQNKYPDKGNRYGILNDSICNFYNGDFTRENKFPLFFPVSYNINYGLKALSSPVSLPKQKMAPFYDILDTIGGAKSITIIQAVALNQLFPIISASAIVDNSYFLDGGVYDNQGFETIFDLYKITRSLRDSFAKHRSIILLSIENGAYELDGKLKLDTTGNIGATATAGLNSIFSTVSMVQKQNGLRSLCPNDTFFQLKVFMPDTSGKYDHWDWFKFQPKPGEVVMSRFINSYELDTISSLSNKVVNEFKVELSDFLTRKKGYCK